MFANAQLARAAAEKEIEEARARTVAQRALADAQAQAVQRALTVAREKAANEAKSEFMSLMCHEVRARRTCARAQVIYMGCAEISRAVLTLTSVFLWLEESSFDRSVALAMWP